MLAPCRAAIARAGARISTSSGSTPEAYGEARAISFDYAIMEKADRVVAVPLDCGWSDLGAWDALWQRARARRRATARWPGAVTAIDCRDSYLRSRGRRRCSWSASGSTDVVAVAMRDAVLVADKSRAQDVKQVVDPLRRRARRRPTTIRAFTGPGAGTRRSACDTRFQVKRIMVKPGGILSLQSHTTGPSTGSSSRAPRR